MSRDPRDFTGGPKEPTEPPPDKLLWDRSQARRTPGSGLLLFLVVCALAVLVLSFVL